MAALDNLRKAAKGWLKSLRDGDPEARARLTRAYPEAPDRPMLRDVQHALARERGHDSWIAMTRAIADRSASETPLALHLAVANKLPLAVAALIEAGADLNRVDAVGLTPLDQAALDGQDDIVQMLIAAGAAISLPAAIVLERHDDIERVLRDDPEALSTTNDRQWARLLVHASTSASGRVLDTLLRTVMRHRSGLSIVNMEDDRETAVDGVSGYTPLHAAAFNGNDESGSRDDGRRGWHDAAVVAAGR